MRSVSNRLHCGDVVCGKYTLPLDGIVRIRQHEISTNYVTTTSSTTSKSGPQKARAADPPFPVVANKSCFVGGFQLLSVINSRHRSPYCLCAVHIMCSTSGARGFKYDQGCGNTEPWCYGKLVTMLDFGFGGEVQD